MKKVKLCSNIDLKSMNSFGVSAKAKKFFGFESSEQLMELFTQNEDFVDNFCVLGAGNNIVFTKDIDRVTLHCEGKKIIRESSDVVYAQGGVCWDDLVEWSVENNLWGLENLSAIPSSVGASPVQNIGAYGVEAKDVILNVEVFLPRTKQVVTLTNKQCKFAYRDSIFKGELKDQAVIIGVRFKLKINGTPSLDYGALKQQVLAKGEPSLKNIRASVIEIRDSKLPDPKVLGNVGSFFQNPICERAFVERLKAEFPDLPYYETQDKTKLKIAAGWLIDKAGWKGKSEGRVGVHSNQALVLVNLGGATGQEIITFANKIIQDIYSKFSIKIQMEVNVW